MEWQISVENQVSPPLQRHLSISVAGVRIPKQYPQVNTYPSDFIFGAYFLPGNRESNFSLLSKMWGNMYGWYPMTFNNSCDLQVNVFQIKFWNHSSSVGSFPCAEHKPNLSHYAAFMVSGIESLSFYHFRL